MITVEEVKLYIPYAPEESYIAIHRYIKSLYIRRHNYIDEADYDVEVVKILERASNNYNPKLGHLVRYIKNTLSLKLKDYVNRQHQVTMELSEDWVTEELVGDLVDTIEKADLSQYSDEVIQAIFNVVSGVKNKKDKDLISKLFSVDTGG